MSGDDPAAVAALVQRLSVLLDAGLDPLAAWRALARSDGCPEPVARAASRAASAHELPDELRIAAGSRGEAWTAVAAALRVAEESGAPLAPTLARLAGVLRGIAESRREIETALAGPVATARLVLLLPLAGLGLGALMGADVIGTLVGTPPGWGCLIAGILLLLGAALVTRRMIAVARRSPRMPGLVLDLVAVAVSGGMGADRARACVRGAVRGSEADAGWAQVDDVLAFAVESGVPASALLRAEAEEARRAARARGARRAAVLGVRLMLPLGLGVLPAFLAIGVAPVVLSLVSSTVAVLR